MTARPPAPVTGVVGGAGGMAATYAAVLALADRYDAAAGRMRGWAALGARALVDPDLVASAALAPITFAEAEAAILAASSGPEGVLAASVGWEGDAVLIRTTVAALEETDRLVTTALQSLDREVGRMVGFAIGSAAATLLPLLVAGGLAARLARPHLPADVRRAVGETEEQAAAGLSGWAVAHPSVVEHAVDGGGGLLAGLAAGVAPLAAGALLGVPVRAPDAGSGAAALAELYDDGTARTTRLDHPLPGDGVQPDSVRALLGHLHRVAELSPTPDSALNGTIEVQTIRAADGSVRHIVYLPGTDDLTTLPWTEDGDVRDMGTNLRLIAGETDAYQRGILEAMARAGIAHHDPVLLVGHSQGGMEAAAILGHGSGYHVTHVVTAGSPTAQVHGFPAGSHVLSLENDGDVVPLLDGAENPDSVEQVTVHVAAGGAGLVGHHEYAPYLAGAAAVDASRDPSIEEQLASMRTHGFLAGTGPAATVTSQVFQIVRAP